MNCSPFIDRVSEQRNAIGRVRLTVSTLCFNRQTFETSIYCAYGYDLSLQGLKVKVEGYGDSKYGYRPDVDRRSWAVCFLVQGHEANTVLVGCRSLRDE